MSKIVHIQFILKRELEYDLESLRLMFFAKVKLLGKCVSRNKDKGQMLIRL
jgi:hypothetical protein